MQPPAASAAHLPTIGAVTIKNINWDNVSTLASSTKRWIVGKPKVLTKPHDGWCISVL
jgi:hypothetical protein